MLTVTVADKNDNFRQLSYSLELTRFSKLHEASPALPMAAQHRGACASVRRRPLANKTETRTPDDLHDPGINLQLQLLKVARP